MFISILKIISIWFYEKEFGTLTGLTNVVASMGSILAQTPLVVLVSRFTWRYSFVIIGFIGILSAALCFLVVRNKPADIGLPGAASSGKEGKRRRESQCISKCSLKSAETRIHGLQVLHNAGFYGAMVSLTGTWGPSYLTNVYGMSTVKAANFIIIIILGGTVAGFSIGRIFRQDI